MINYTEMTRAELMNVGVDIEIEREKANAKIKALNNMMGLIEGTKKRDTASIKGVRNLKQSCGGLLETARNWKEEVENNYQSWRKALEVRS